MRPSRIATSAVRAGAPVPSTTVPPRIRRSHCDVIEVARVEPVQGATVTFGKVVVVLSELVEHAGVLRVVVGKVRRPDQAIRTDQRTEHPRRTFPGIEADPALPLEVLLGTEGHRRGGPVVALFELVEAVHPVGDPTATALEHGHLQSGMTLEHAAVGQVREGDHLVDDRDERVMGTRRHQRTHSACGSRHVGETGDVQPEREPGLLECFPHRVYTWSWNGTPLYAFGRTKVPTSPMSLTWRASSAAATGSWSGSAPVPFSRS